MRRVGISTAGAVAALALTAMLACSVVTVVGASPSLYPATLTMQRGLYSPFPPNHLPWGTKLTAAQARAVTFTSSGSTYRWGVWIRGHGTEQFPVRSTDGGARWMAAGPQLASDWVGGSAYYVNKSIAKSAATVVMVGNAAIDVTSNSGHQWYQYVNAAVDWNMISCTVPDGGIALRVNVRGQKGTYAIYVLDVATHQWHRTAEKLS